MSSLPGPAHPYEAVLAHMIMAKKDSSSENTPRATIKKDWESGRDGGAGKALFKPEELDIYVNKVTLDAYIFHGKQIDYESLDRLEYDPADYSVTVIRKDGARQDLGVKIQWLVRPHFVKAKEVSIVRTQEGKSIDGTTVPLVHKKKK